MAGPSSLTFGVKIEFILATLSDLSVRDLHPTDPHPVYNITKSIVKRVMANATDVRRDNKSYNPPGPEWAVSGSPLAFDVSALKSPFPHPLKRTIAFHQHEAMLDPELLGHWIHPCVGSVVFADKVDRFKLERFLYEHFDDGVEKFNIAKVLVAIDVAPQTHFYGCQVAKETGEKSKLPTSGEGE